MNVRVLYWGLYDFANSIVLMAFLFYFSQWLVLDEGRPGWWYNGALIAASLLFILSIGPLSRRIDASGKKIAGLRLWSMLSIAALGIVSLITVFSHTLDVLAVALYTFGMYSYLMCYLYFTPMLNDLSTSESRSWVSGIGQAFNSGGQVAGLLLTLPFATGAITLLGEAGRAQALLPSVLLFFVFALPLLFLYKDSPPTQSQDVIAPEASSWRLFKTVFSHRSLALLLIAYFFFSDGLLTFAANFPLYLEKVLGVTDLIKALLTVGILVLATLGALLFGLFAKFIGEKKVLLWILVGEAFIFLGLGTLTNFPFIVGLCLIAGVLYGPAWSISRALVGQLAPPGLTASSYSYFTVAERFATFLGPAAWSIALIIFGGGKNGYQAAILSMGILLLIGVLLLQKIREAGEKS